MSSKGMYQFQKLLSMFVIEKNPVLQGKWRPRFNYWSPCQSGHLLLASIFASTVYFEREPIYK